MSESPPSSTICPRCSAPLAPTAAQGALCPRCLLAQGMAHSDPALDTDAGEKSPPPVPPELSEIAPLFPELEIVELLGQGGMGAVYKARQRALGRWVALKILTPRAGDENGFAARFEREAHALARLAHPNVVGIHDSGRTQGRCWLLMEYVEGLNLRQLLRSGELDVPRALAIVRQMCDALEFAHEQGIVHRDIKPENVLVDKKGRVKIADFGLAKIVGETAGAESITRTQQSMGTPQYMAPEQLTGSRDVDHRADIYSLGVVFYELLTGELPLGRFEPPSQRVQVDVRLDEVVLRALEHAPERRYQHATEMKTGIEGLDKPAPAAASPRSPVANPAWMFGLCAVPAVGFILELALRVLGIQGLRRAQFELGYVALVLVALCIAAWKLRRDRRGAVLSYGLAAIAAGIAIAGILRVRDLVAIVGPRLSLDQRPADAWIARLLLALAAFEALRFAWSARRSLTSFLVDRSSLRWVDLCVASGSTLLALMYLKTNSWDELLGAELFLPIVGLVLLAADWAACRHPANGPEPRAWLRRRVDEERTVAALLATPGPARRSRWVRSILMPVLVAISAWIMTAYTSAWGWYGIVASSLVLALAIAGYLQQTIPIELLQELRSESLPRRSLRALAAILVLSIGALCLGAAALDEQPDRRTPAREPSAERVVHLAELVAANSRESIDPLQSLALRVAASQCTSVTVASASPERPDSREPYGLMGVFLILLAPELLLWTRRWGDSWAGCRRYSAEVLLIVLAGMLSSIPLRAWLLPAGSHAESAPLIVEANFPSGALHTSERFQHALALEGYALDGRLTWTFGDAEGAVLLVDSLRARSAGGTGSVLKIELAGDVGQWGSAIRIDAGPVRAAVRAQRREMLTRILQHTRRD